MTANKYRNAAAKAGYVICAESRDEMIVHSKQFPSAVQLDAEGNLLEGDVESKSLPNLYGAPVHYDSSEAAVTREVSVQKTESNVKQPCYVEDGVQTSHVPYPSPLHSPRAPSQSITAELQKAATSISTLVPGAVEQGTGTTSVIDNEYDSAEPATDEFIVYDAGAEHNERKVPDGSTNTAQAKRKASENHTDDRSHKKHRSSAQISPQRPPVSLVPLVVTLPKEPGQKLSDFLLTPDSDCKTEPSPSSTSSIPPGDFSQNHTSNPIETSTPSNPTLESELSALSETPRIQGSNSWSKMSRSESVDDKDTVANAKLSSPSKMRGHSHIHRAPNKPEPARLKKEALKPTVPPALVETERRGLGLKIVDPASR